MCNLVLANIANVDVGNKAFAESDRGIEHVLTVPKKIDITLGKESEHIRRCILLLLDKLQTEDQIVFAVEVLTAISTDKEREEIIGYILPFIGVLEGGYDVVRVIRQLAGIPSCERENVSRCMLSFIGKAKANQIEGLLKGLVAIPNEKRGMVSVQLLCFINQLQTDDHIIDVCKWLAKTSNEKRENVVGYLLHSLDRLDGTSIVSLLKTLAEVPDEKNIIHCLRTFDHKLQTGLQIQSMVGCLADIPSEKRESIIRCGWNLFNGLENSQIQSVLKVLAEIPEEERENSIDCMLRHISRLRGSDMAPTLKVLAEIPEAQREQLFDYALSLVDMEISESTNVKPAWMFLARHEAFLQLFNKNHHQSFPGAKPEVVRVILQYLELKGSMPKGRCLICENRQVFQQQFNENQTKFDEPFSFLVLSEGGGHWTNITVQKKCVVITDSLGKKADPSTETEMDRYMKTWAPAYKLYHVFLKRQHNFTGCWVFALRDAVELLRMKDIQTLVNDEHQIDLPIVLLKSMQSLSFFNDTALLNQNVQSRKKGVEQTQTFGELLNQHKKMKNKKYQNCYIEDRRAKYEEILIRSLPVIKPEEECSSALEIRFSQFVMESAVTHCIDRKKNPNLQIVLPLTAKYLPIDILLRASAFLYQKESK
jgi:hypothetical protein